MKAIRFLVALAIPGSLFGGLFVNNPRKVAQEQAAQAFKTAGVHTKGIVGNVNEVQDAVGRIKRGMDELQRAIYAPRSPLSRLPRITNDLVQLQKSVPIVEKIVSGDELPQFLSGDAVRDEILKKISSKQQQKLARAFYGTYEGLLAEMDAVVIHAMLHHTRQMLYDVAGMMDSLAHIRDYGGDYSDTVLDLDAIQRIREVSTALRALASKLNEIMQGGSRSMRSERESFAKRILTQPRKLDRAMDSMRKSSSAINTVVRSIQSDLKAATKGKNDLIRAATLMNKRLTQTLLKAQKGDGGQHIVALATAELRVMMEGLHAPLINVLRITVDIVQQTISGLQAGMSGMNSFKTSIGFDVVNPVVRVDLDALPKLLRELSRTITQLRGVVSQ